MSLRLICGKSGTGKSQYCLEEIKEKIKENKKIYIITPEQFSYAEEKKMLEIIGKNAVIEAEVLTFERMAHRVSSKLGGIAKQTLSKAGKAMLIYHILSNKKNDFTFLGKSKQNVEVIDTQITEFKKHGITTQMLEEYLEKTEDKYLKAKVDDMLLIYKDYENKLKNNYIEENDRLTILANQLEKEEVFKDAIFYIDEFVGFTKQEYNVIKQLIRMAKEVTVTITTDNLDMGTSMDSDIFYYNKQTADKLLYIAKEQDIECKKTIFLDNTYRFKNEELKHLEQNLEKIPYVKYNKEPENIKIFLATNPYTEVEEVARKISKLVKEENYRYRDIAVIAKDLETTYSSLCKAIFSEYDISYFIDEKKELSQNILIKYIISILDIYAQNWSLESVMNYIKIGFIELDDEDIYIFENKVRKWGIKGSKWYSSNWNYEEETDENKELLDKIKSIRNEVIDPLKQLKDSLSGTKTARQITQKLYEFITKNNAYEKIIKIEQEKGLSIELVEEYKLVWEIVIDLLDEIVMLFGEEKFTFEEYSEIIRIGLGNSSLGTIPQTQDQVLVGDIERSKSHKVKAVFLLGVNDGVFPSIYKKEGFFKDKDREELKQNGIELAKQTIERLYEDKFSIYKVFTLAENKLYISYTSADMESKPLRPSIYIMKLKKIFPKMEEKSDLNDIEEEFINVYSTFNNLIDKIRQEKEGNKVENIWKDVYNYYATSEQWKDKLQTAINALNKEDRTQNITKENIEKLYGKKLSTTISRLEQYRSCPFSYYLKYGLKLKTKDEFKVQAIDTGTFMHDILDTFFKQIKENGYSVKTITEEQIEEIVNNIVNDKLSYAKNYIFTSTDKFKVLTSRLKRLITKSIKYMVEGLKNSDFEVFETEAEFKENSNYKPIEMTLEDGKKVELTGKIDRIDLAKTSQGNYIRIIDYKSSIKNIDLNEVVAGIQIQLLTYLDAACKNEQVMPAGILYYNLIEPVLKSEKPMTEEQIEEEMRKKFKMQGLILADINIVKKMDKKLEKGQSNVIPAYIDKDGNLSKGKSNAISKEEFEILQQYTTKTIKEISREILSGNINQEPYYSKKTKRTPCEYCEFKSICDFRQGECNNQYRFIENKKKEEILNKIKEEENDNTK